MVRITGPVMDVDNPSFSPGGKWIAVSNVEAVKGAEADELWIINESTGETRKLLDHEKLGSYGSDSGYSIWNIRWMGSDVVSFSLSDNESRQLEVTCPIQPLSEPVFGVWKEADFKSPSRMPAGLKMFLLMHYPPGSSERKHLSDYPSWFDYASHEGRWYVHHLGDTYILVVDLEKKQAVEAVISRNEIGDDLEFRSVGGRLLAVYSGPHQTMRGEGVAWHYVDEIVPEGKSRNLFRVRGFPTIKAVGGDSEMFVYGRVLLHYPFYRMEILHYTFGGQLSELEADMWHNADFSEDGKRVAFIKVVDGIRLLYVGKIGK
jgi:hypothetical protein